MIKDSVKINFNGEEFEFKKVPMRRYPELALTLNNIPDVVMNVFNGEEDLTAPGMMLQKLPNIILGASETLPPFLAVASGIDLEKVLDGGLDDFLVLAQAVLEINNVETIIKHLKNFMPTQK